MKTIQVIILFSLSLILFSCDNENTETFDLSIESLKQPDGQVHLRIRLWKDQKL